MKSLHLINKRNGLHLLNLEYDQALKQHRTGNWQFTLQEAQSLIGGKVYLHETKAKPSTIGGTVLDVEPSLEESRVVFIFTSEIGGKSKKWSGKDHGMAWTSGIIDDQ
ncbi:hypothetical protein [Loktanella salsilacus]|uniref:hypothetical protein n=1 Tax=Loktanella salsilacus TaxID=195913 RepID=UPI0020B64722|nr:hypothetical protein [Loktanella salsilacus]UTH43679.1 hypothetical protein KBK07_11230 [Loktanella salsilacus]